MENETYERAKALFAQYQIALPVPAYEQLCAYAALLDSESSVQNLTASSTLSEVWTRHFLDAAYVLRWLTDDASVIDIGTGGGIPGIPLAILNPTLRITLLDSEQNKIRFCRNAAEQLGLSVVCVCARAEEYIKESGCRDSFDFAVSRAMASGSMLSELAFPFLKKGGKLLAMKGRCFDMEAERFDCAAKALGGDAPEVIPYTLEGEQKVLVSVLKSGDTPAQFPRRFARIKRNPL